MILWCLCDAGGGEIEVEDGLGREIDDLELGSSMAAAAASGGAGEGERPSGEVRQLQHVRVSPGPSFYRARRRGEGPTTERWWRR